MSDTTGLRQHKDLMNKIKIQMLEVHESQKKVLVGSQTGMPEQDIKLIIYLYDASQVITVRICSVPASSK